MTTIPPAAATSRLSLVRFGFTVSLFFAVTYTLCILFYLVLPDLASGHAVLTLFLPGFKLLTWGSFVLGLVESLVLGWYIALVFGVIHNWVAGWRLG